MRCLLTALVAVLAATVALAQAPGQCKPSGRIDEGLRQLNEEYTAVMKETARRVQAGEDRRTVIDWSTRRRNELGVRAIELARADPKDPAAVDALTWVLGHSASRAVVEAQALEILARDYAESDRLEAACDFASHFDDRGTKEAERFLREVLARNPHRSIKGWACYCLASLLENRARRIQIWKDYPDAARRFAEVTDHVFGPGTRKEIVAELARRSPEDLRKEAEELFERVIEQYGNIVPAWADKSKTTLGQRAEGILNRIRHLEIGKVAPEIEGEDVDGTRFKLSDYRGKVVLLTFTGDWCPPCHSLYPHERRFIEQLKGRPFVVLSVETDQDRETWRKAIAKGDVGWRCWWDGSTHGPITTSWGVKGFPSLYLIDARGVIRDHGRGGIDEKDAEALFTKIKSLVQDAEAAAKP